MKRFYLFVVSTGILAVIATTGLLGCFPSDDGQYALGPVGDLMSDSGLVSNLPVDINFASSSGQMIIAWPFGSLELMKDWTGWEGDRTAGSTEDAPYCNGRPSTHSGAEKNARDLNQVRGLDYGIKVFAGFAGKVIYAGWQNGYGKTVVIYDKSRHVAVRYAHLSYIYSAVYIGRIIPLHFFLGATGNTGYTQGAHLHVVGYENVNDNNGKPIIPTLCDSEFYACRIYFSWWAY